MPAEYLPIESVNKIYPMFCETQCCAWNPLYKSCNGRIMGRTECSWSVNKITARISEKRKIAGDKWWRAPKGSGDGSAAEDADTSVG